MIDFETAKALHRLFDGKGPSPMDHWYYNENRVLHYNGAGYPAYEFDDIISEPLCVAVCNVTKEAPIAFAARMAYHAYKIRPGYKNGHQTTIDKFKDEVINLRP